MVLPALQGAHLAICPAPASSHALSLQELRQCTKQFSLWTMPNILVVQLKRFSTTNVRNYSYYGTTATTEKITTPVDFPDVLDLTPCAACRLLLWGRTRAHSVHARRYVKGDAVREPPPREYIYDLYAVVNQSGGAPSPHFRRRVVCLTRRASCFAPQAWRAGTTSPTPARCPRFERRSGTTTTTRTSPRCRRMTSVRPQRTVSARARPWRPSRCARVAHAPRRVAQCSSTSCGAGRVGAASRSRAWPRRDGGGAGHTPANEFYKHGGSRADGLSLLCLVQTAQDTAPHHSMHLHPPQLPPPLVLSYS